MRTHDGPTIAAAPGRGRLVLFPPAWDADRVAGWLSGDGQFWLGRHGPGSTANWELPPGVTLLDIARRLSPPPAQR